MSSLPDVFTRSPVGARLSSERREVPGAEWAVLDGRGDVSWMAVVPRSVAALVVIDADRGPALRDALAGVASALGRSPAGLLLRDGGLLAQERAWPTVAELVDEDVVRCGGLVTARAAVLDRCTPWRPVDAVLIDGGRRPDPDAELLVEACRWSGVQVLRPGSRPGEIVVVGGRSQPFALPSSGAALAVAQRDAVEVL